MAAAAGGGAATRPEAADAGVLSDPLLVAHNAHADDPTLDHALEATHADGTAADRCLGRVGALLRSLHARTMGGTECGHQCYPKEAQTEKEEES